MNNPVRTKASKKQPAKAVSDAVLAFPSTVINGKQTLDSNLAESLMALENTCAGILEAGFSGDREDVESLSAHQRLKNIAKSVSLALGECKGPRHFHQHYRHREHDESVLYPVLDDPLKTLALAVQSALKGCQSLVVHDVKTLKMQSRFESALRQFSASYKTLS